MVVLRCITSRSVLLLCYVAVSTMRRNVVLATIKTDTDTSKSNAPESQLFFEKISKYCFERYDTSCFWLDCLRFVESYYNFTSVRLFKGVYIDRENGSSSSGRDAVPAEFYDQKRQMEESPSQLLDTYIRYKIDQIFGSMVVKIHLLPDKSEPSVSNNNTTTTATRSNSVLDAGRRRVKHLSSTLYAVVLGTAAAMLTKSLTLSVIAIILTVLRVPRFPLLPGFNSENSSYRLASPPYPVLFNHNHHHASEVQYVDDVGGSGMDDVVRDTYHINYWPRKKHNPDDGDRRQTAKV